VNWSVLLLCIASAFGAWHWWTTEREVARLPGILVSDEPLQRDVETPRRFEHRHSRPRRLHVEHVATPRRRRQRRLRDRVRGSAGRALKGSNRT
jgi:hypothetical protein